jgi:filamentous hemagglutinin
MKKKFLTGLTVILLSMGLILVGCEGPTGADGAGGGGSAGPIYLSGPQEQTGIEAALASGAPLTFAGVTVTASTPLVIDRSVTLVGSPAIAVTGTVVANGDYLGGTGTITATTVVGPAATLAKVSSGNKVAPIAGGTAAVIGAVEILTSGTAAGELTASTVPADLFVFGDVTVTNAVTTNLTVQGKVTQATGAVVTGAVTTSGDFTSAVTGSAAVSGVLTVGGNATFSGVEASTSANLLTVGGNLVATGATTSFTAGGALAITGTSSFGKDVDLTAVNATFTGGVTFAAGTITINSGDTLVLTGGNLVAPAGTAVVTASDALVLGSGTLTVGATSIASGTDGAITAASVAQLEVLLPKAGDALNAGLANSGTLAANAVVKDGTVLTIAPGKSLNTGTATLTVGNTGGTNASVLSKATLTAGGSSSTGITLTGNTGVVAFEASTANVTGSIKLESGGGIGLKGSGGVNFGSELTLLGASATAVGTDKFDVSEGAITIAASGTSAEYTLTGAATGSKLALAGGTATAVLAVAGSKKLTVTDAEIDLSANGKLSVLASGNLILAVQGAGSHVPAQLTFTDDVWVKSTIAATGASAIAKGARNTGNASATTLTVLNGIVIEGATNGTDNASGNPVKLAVNPTTAGTLSASSGNTISSISGGTVTILGIAVSNLTKASTIGVSSN